MRRALSILVFVFATYQLFAQAGPRIMESQAMPSRILGQDVLYSVVLPADYYRSEKSYPVVYLLHGLGDDESSWLEYGRISQYYDAETEKGAITPMIFIMPQGYRNYYVNDFYGSFLYEDMFVHEFVPFIDSLFRTVADKQHRSLMGYSMGGFGALVLHLKHPEIFGSAVPLSISVRTDEQYMKEYAPEWDEQWGRLFGAKGIEGPGRITDYYRENSPFHIIAGLSPDQMKNYNIYIDNGDKEQTLCRSNEELHILMQSRGFPHEFRVREGGHSFEHWCSALPNALRFLSDAFQGKPYRGNEKEEITGMALPESQITEANIDGHQFRVFLPAEYTETDRLYPVLYFAGELTAEQCRSVAAVFNKGIESNENGPLLIVFLPSSVVAGFTGYLPEMEKQLRIRPGYRFRSMAGFGETAVEICRIVTGQEQFSSCFISDGFLQKDEITALLASMQPGFLKKTLLFIDAPDNGKYVEGNGFFHITLRDMEILHEYRVREGSGGFDWMLEGLKEASMIIGTNFHR